MPQIALVSDQHDDDVRVSVVAELLQPPGHILICLVLADIVDKQSTNSTPVIGRCNGSVSLLASSVPNLRLDGLSIDLDRPSSEFDADSRLRIEVEFVASETAQQVGFTDT